MKPRDWLELFAAVVFILSSLVGCKPEIGDDCTVSTDCSATGDRLCDTTQPGGYCTIFNCEPGTCPEEAICVGFAAVSSTAPACLDLQASSRFERVFCVRNCEDDDDCRGGYECIDIGKPGNPWGARVVERGSVNGAVCVVPFTASGPSELQQTEVCTGTDAGLVLPEPTPEPDAGPDGGADAQPTTDTGVDAPPDGGSDAGADADAGTDAELD